MERRAFETPLGEVWLHGEPTAFADSRQPIVLAISGAFVSDAAFDRLPIALPSAAVLISHLPGNHSPPLVTTSVGAFAAAYRAVVQQLGREVIICGSSLGGLVGLAVSAPNLRAVVALDPPFRTAKQWRLIERFRSVEASQLTDFDRLLLWNVFGISETLIEDRNYMAVLQGLRTRALCFLGGLPLMPPRVTSVDPSMVDEPERAALEAHPLVEVRVLPGVGHNIVAEAGPPVVAALRAAIVAVKSRSLES
jgi:pimeloyl-ACP methyl ester carboxylesterase